MLWLPRSDIILLTTTLCSSIVFCQAISVKEMVLQCKTSVFVQLVTFKVFGVCVLRRSEIARVKLMKYAREQLEKKEAKKVKLQTFLPKVKLY